MKVSLLNGSPNEKGCTYTTLSEVTRILEEEGIGAEIVHVRKNCVMGCTGCGACSGSENRCIFSDGIVNEVLGKIETTGGLTADSPVYFAPPTDAVLSLLGGILTTGGRSYLKPAAAVAPARRAGTTATIDVLNKYFNLAGTLIVSSNYYDAIHEHTSEEARQNEEGMQTMRTLGRNMAWMLKRMEAGRKKGLVIPEKESKIRTSYIRQITCFGYHTRHCLKCCG